MFHKFFCKFQKCWKFETQTRVLDNAQKFKFEKKQHKKKLQSQK